VIFLLYPTKEEQLKIHARKRANDWRKAHPIESKQYCIEWNKNNKELKKKNDAEYYLAHKDKIKANVKLYQNTSEVYKSSKRIAGALWRKENPDYLKDYYLEHKEQMNNQTKENWKNNKLRIAATNKAWAELNINKVRIIKQRYKKTDKGKIATSRHHDYRRYMGSNMINAWFRGCNRHHVTKNDIICVPKELHKSIHHDHKKPETMNKINILAWDYLETSSL